MTMTNVAQDEFTPARVHALPSPAPAEDDEVRIGEIIGLFWRRKFWIAGFMLLCMILGFLYVQQVTRLYYAETKLILESKEQNALGFDSLVSGISEEDSEMNSQIEVIKSRRLIGQVVDELKLTNDPEYVLSLRDPTLKIQAINWVKSVIGVVPGPDLSNPREGAIDQLTRKLRVSILPQTHVFQISLETQSAPKSVAIVNTLADAFVTDQVTAKLESTDAAALWLGNKVADLGEKLGAAEARAANFRSQTERAVTEQDIAQSNLNLKNARGRLDSFVSALENATGSTVPATDRDRTRMNSFLRDIAELESIVRRQTEDLLVIRQLDREAAAAGAIYEHFAGRLNEIEVQKGLQESDVRILSEAVPRYRATKPKKALTVAIFGILGLLLSAGYFLVRKFMDRSFYDPAELQRAFGIPVIGAISRAPTTNRVTLLNYVIKRPSSRIMEAIRDLRTSLMVTKTATVQGIREPGKVLVFTSSVPAEGKTTSSILLAMNSAALDKRVLLVECDLRRSTFKTYFGPQKETGLLHAIENGDAWEDTVWNDRRTNLDIIFGGVSKGRNAGDIFASQEFADFIERVKSAYDLVILDSPPVLPVPDARLIAKLSDKIVYVVRSASTPSSTVAAGLRLFGNMGIKPDGLVLTQVRQGKGYGYGYGGYGYGYGSEYYNN